MDAEVGIMEQVMLLVVFGMIIAGLVLAIIVWRWLLDYQRPQWRRERWREWPDRTISYRPDWQPWFAWRPIRTLSNRVVWWTTVYRSSGNDYVDHDDWRWYHYADEFDLLKLRYV